MNTKKITVAKAKASFSTTASHMTTITMPRAPWEEDDEPRNIIAQSVEADERKAEKPKRAARHLGPYKRNRAGNA